MTLLSLTDCCRQLGIDGKTLRRWLEQAQLSPQAHPSDARLKGLTGDQLRLLAQAHHRSLTPLAEAGPMPTASMSAEPSPPLPNALLEVLHTLSTLPAQLAALQQQLADLSAWLHQPAQPPAPTQEGRAAVTKTSACPRPAAGSSQKLPQPPRHVLALVEYAGQGHYVVICPTHGLLPIEPETPAWFAWLATRSSFRFVGKGGRLTAHRELERVPTGAWRAHRKIRNHTYNVRLGSTESLTIAVLEQAAADLQARLA